jgi:3-oxoacyl-[acyl-carrier-protein] synthase-3
MAGRDVFRFATRVVPDSVVQALEAANLTTADIDLLILHQANVRIIDSAAKRLKVDASSVFANVEKYGNTSAASIPVALCEAIDEGRVTAGSTVVMSGFGAGLSWGTAVWKWQG